LAYPDILEVGLDFSSYRRAADILPPSLSGAELVWCQMPLQPLIYIQTSMAWRV